MSIPGLEVQDTLCLGSLQSGFHHEDGEGPGVQAIELGVQTGIIIARTERVQLEPLQH